MAARSEGRSRTCLRTKERRIGTNLREARKAAAAALNYDALPRGDAAIHESLGGVRQFRPPAARLVTKERRGHTKLR